MDDFTKPKIALINDLGQVTKNALGPFSSEFGEQFKPAGKALGKTSAAAIMLLLKPIYGTIWGADKIMDWVVETVQKKLNKIPETQLISPNPAIAGPIIEAMRFQNENEEIRNLFANLLANSMDKDTATNSHPAYVEIIKQLTNDEAKILKYISRNLDALPLLELRMKFPNESYKVIFPNFTNLPLKAGCIQQELFGAYLDNLCRLELIYIPSGVSINNNEIYRELEKLPQFQTIKKEIEDRKKEIANEHEAYSFGYEKKLMELTEFGKIFIKICVEEK